MTTVQEKEARNGESAEGIREMMPSKRETWKDRIEEWLCDAAIRGDVKSLKEIMKIDDHILDKVLVGSFKGKNPLHMATSTGQKEFVQELLEYKQDLAKAVDTELGTALHIASSKGYSDIVKLLVKVSPEMCVARDREGNNPLHIAAMKGKVEVLKVLLRTNPHAARQMVDRGENILHLCVNYNQLASLELLLDVVGDEFANSTDVNGNNILHLAVFGKRCKIIIHLLEWLKKKKKKKGAEIMCFGSELGEFIDVNARNRSGWTALDIHSRVAESEDKKSEYRGIGDLLRKYGVRRSDKLFFPFDPYWQKKKKDTLMIVSSLMATMSFQVGINPPGGVWVDSSPAHEIGKAIIAYTNPKAYPYLVYFNTVGFLLSLTTILELIVVLPTKKRAFGFIRAGISWLTIMIMAFAYTFSVIVVTPTEMYKSVKLVILVIVVVWAVVISFLRVLPHQVQSILLGVIFLPLRSVLVVVLLSIAVCCLYMTKDTASPAIESTVKSTEDTASPAIENTVQSNGDTASLPIENTVQSNGDTASLPIEIIVQSNGNTASPPIERPVQSNGDTASPPIVSTAQSTGDTASPPIPIAAC